MQKIKRLLCIVLCVIITVNFVFISSETVKADTISKTILDVLHGTMAEFSKIVNLALGTYGATTKGNYSQLCENLQEYIDNVGSGELIAVEENTETGEMIITEDFMNLLKEYLDTLKDSSGNYPADSGLQSYEFQWVKTNTNRNVWQKYYEDYEPLYDDAHVEKIGDYDNFLKRFSDFFALSPIEFGGASLHPAEPGMLFVIPDKDKKIFIHTECCRGYADIDKTVWFYYVGSITAADKWTIDSNYVCSSSTPIYSPAGFRRSVNENGKLNDFNYVNQKIDTYWCGNSYMVYNAKDCGSYYYIDSVGTPDGSYIRLFKTDDDAKAYYNATQGCNLPSYPYTGGNITIINGDVNYDNPDKPLNPDGPGGEKPDTPSDYGGWLEKIYDKLCGIYNQLVLNNVLTAVDALYDIFKDLISGAVGTVDAVSAVVEERFPFCLIFDAYLLLSVAEAEPVAPSFEIPFRYSRYFDDGTEIVIDETIVLDFERFSPVVEVVRYFELFFFIWSLVMLTFKITGGIKGGDGS